MLSSSVPAMSMVSSSSLRGPRSKSEELEREVRTALQRFAAGEVDEDTVKTMLFAAVERDESGTLHAAAEAAAGDAGISDLARTRLFADIPPPAPRAASPAVPGMVIRERFILEEEIGSGGMGVVFRARDLRREEAEDRFNRVAIKVMNQSLQAHPDAFVTLQRETRRAQQLAHPNIATVYDFDRDGDVAFMCMELLEGQPLNKLMQNADAIPVEAAFAIIRGMCDGLAYAHGRNIVHADLKPGNVFVTNHNVVKLLDFGLARTVRSADASSSMDTKFDAGRWQAMTPAYASVEMFERKDPDPRDDIYALACVSYELLAGHHPFARMAANVARDQSMVPKPIRGLTRRQNKALRAALAFDRAERIDSVESFRDMLVSKPARGPTALVALVGVSSVVGVLALSWLFVGRDTVIHRMSEPVGEGVTPTDRVTPPILPTEDPGGDSSNAKEAQSLAAEDARFEQQAPGVGLPAPVDTDSHAIAGSASLDAPTRARIDRILDIAELHFAMGRIISPRGSNAAEAFVDVVALDPNNARAERGLNKVAAVLSAEARALSDAGEHQRALALVENALAELPDVDLLRELHIELVGRQ